MHNLRDISLKSQIMDVRTRLSKFMHSDKINDNDLKSLKKFISAMNEQTLTAKNYEIRKKYSKGHNIDVYASPVDKLILGGQEEKILDYERKKLNFEVNYFENQTAGFDNTVNELLNKKKNEITQREIELSNLNKFTNKTEEQENKLMKIKWKLN